MVMVPPRYSAFSSPGRVGRRRLFFVFADPTVVLLCDARSASQHQQVEETAWREEAERLSRRQKVSLAPHPPPQQSVNLAFCAHSANCEIANCNAVNCQHSGVAPLVGKSCG